MRAAARLMMASAKVTADGRSMALLPPIPLYRRLLRAHRKFLPKEMRLLGDEYVKAEFRAHRDVENPVHLVRFLAAGKITKRLKTGQRNSTGYQTGKADRRMYECEQIGFLTEWQLYAQKIEGDSWVGEKLDRGKIEKMSGKRFSAPFFSPSLFIKLIYILCRRTAGPAVRTHEGNPKSWFR